MKLGDIDVAVRIGLGTNRLTHSPANVAFVKAAVSAGIEMIDTAHSYTGGQSEGTIGEALAVIPGTSLVATKGGVQNGRPDVLRAEIEHSLRSLRTDRIALYYLHRIDPNVPLEESLGAIKEYQDRGHIRHVGISNVGIDQIDRARRVLPIAAVQNPYNLSDRRHDAVIDYCAGENIVFVPYVPLRGLGDPRLVEIATRYGATPYQIALAWLLRRSPAMLPIPGTLSLAHLKENLGAEDIQLTGAEFEALR